MIWTDNVFITVGFTAVYLSLFETIVEIDRWPSLCAPRAPSYFHFSLLLEKPCDFEWPWLAQIASHKLLHNIKFALQIALRYHLICALSVTCSLLYQPQIYFK